MLPVSSPKKWLIKDRSRPTSLPQTIEATRVLTITNIYRVICLQNVEAFRLEIPIASIKLILITFNRIMEQRNRFCILKLIPVWGCLTLVMDHRVKWVKVQIRISIKRQLIVGKAVKFGYLIVITSKMFDVKA